MKPVWLKQHWGCLWVRYCRSQQTVPTCVTQECHWCVSSHIWSAKNSLGCCLNHFVTACNTSLYDVNVQLSSGFVNGDKHMAVSPICLLDVWASSVTWQWVGPELSVEHMGTGIVKPQDDAYHHITVMHLLCRSFGNIWESRSASIWHSEDRASWYILVIKPTRCINFSNLFLE